MTGMLRWIARGCAMVAMVGMPVAAAFTGGARLVPFLAMPLIVLGGPMLMRFHGSGENDPEADAEDGGGSDDGGGGNRRPDRGPGTPSGPMGELPLEFSHPGARTRGNGPVRTSDPGRRRQPHPAPAPSRRRVPAGPHRR